MKRRVWVVLLALPPVAVVVRRLAARSNTQMHRINPGSGRDGRTSS
jgi:hypothetical protein